MSYISNHISILENKFKFSLHEGQIQVINSFLENKNIFLKGPSGTGKTFIFLYLSYLSVLNLSYQNCTIISGASDDKSKKFFPENHFYSNTLFYISSALSLDASILNNFLFFNVDQLKGRTIDNSIILIDEIQNFTKEQLHSVMSRVGNNSRILITGYDIQSDIPSDLSCFDFAENIFLNMDSFESIAFYHEDISRSDFAKEWICTVEPLLFG